LAALLLMGGAISSAALVLGRFCAVLPAFKLARGRTQGPASVPAPHAY